MLEQSLDFTRKGLSPINKLIILSMFSIILMVLDNRYSTLKYLKGYIATAVYPFQWLSNQPEKLYDYSSNLLTSKTQLIKENNFLKKENSRLGILANQSQWLQTQLNELKIIENLQTKNIAEMINVEVISNGRDALTDKLIIDRGSNDGIKLGNAVLDQNGLIGQITQVNTFTSELTLITNNASVIPVLNARTGERALTYGGGGTINLRYISVSSDIKSSDILVTSGIDSVYPEGIPIAQITNVSKSQGSPFYSIILEPYANFKSSKYLLVIK